MSALQWVRNNSRMIAKGSLYIGGGLAIGLPLVAGAQKALDGATVNDTVGEILWEAGAWHPTEHKVDRNKLAEVAARDLVGAAMIYGAGKL